MLKTYALTYGYRSDTKVVYAEETIYLLQLETPANVSDKDGYLWTESEELLCNRGATIGSSRTFNFVSGEAVTGSLFCKEVRQITNSNIKLRKTDSTLFPISKCFMKFQSEKDFDDYLIANEPDNPALILDIKMSNFSRAFSFDTTG